MEMFTSLWSTAVLPLISSYGFTILSAVVVGLLIALLAVVAMLIKPISTYLITLAEKNLSSKVSDRVCDAIQKVESTLIDLLSIEQNTIKRLAKEAYDNDGQIDMKEVKNIAVQVGNVALQRLTPEVSTIKKYLSGDMIVEYLQDKVAAIVTQSVEKFLNEKLLTVPKK